MRFTNATAGAIAFVFFVSCSSTDVIDRRYLDCEPGQDVSIAAGLDAAYLHDDGTEDHFNVLVEVSNNSHDDITVDAIGVDQLADELTSYTVDRGYGKYGLVITPGKDHTFELPVHGRAVKRSMQSLTASRGIEIRVAVLLEGGDQYRCSFAVGPSR